MSVYEKLYDWQRQIVDAATGRPTYGLFCDCGTGKTPQGLALCERDGVERILVITLASKASEGFETPGSWYKWGLEYATQLNIVNKNADYETLKRPIPTMYVVNYEWIWDRKRSNAKEVYLRPEIEAFIAGSAGMKTAIVCDESHRFQDDKSKQTKAVFELKNTLKRVTTTFAFALTGTPFTSNYLGVWSQLKFLGCPITKSNFMRQFCKTESIWGKPSWCVKIKGFIHMDDLYDLVHQYGVTVKSEDVVTLPEQIFEWHIEPVSEPFKLFNKKTISETRLKKEMLRSEPFDYEPFRSSYSAFHNPWYHNLDYPSTEWFADTPAKLWLRARQLSIGFLGNADNYAIYDKSRFERIGEFLQDNPGNYVIFYNYVPEFEMLYEICSQLGYKIDVYNGATKDTSYYDEFCRLDEGQQIVDNGRVILANFSSGSTGKNWQAYSRTIIASIPVYKDWEQGLKRTSRLGQRYPTWYHVFASENWLDIGMLDAISNCTNYTDELFLNDFSVHENDYEGE